MQIQLRPQVYLRQVILNIRCKGEHLIVLAISTKFKLINIKRHRNCNCVDENAALKSEYDTLR